MPIAERTADVAVSVRTRKIADLPGPKGIALLGNMLQIDSMQFHRVLENWASEFGPYYRMRLGRKQMLVLSDNAAIATLLRERPEVIRRSTRTSTAFDDQ